MYSRARETIVESACHFVNLFLEFQIRSVQLCLLSLLEDSDQWNVDIKITFDEAPISEKWVDVEGIDVVINQKKFEIVEEIEKCSDF